MYKTKGFILHIKTICIKSRDFSTFSKSRAIRKDFTHTCKNDKGKATCQHKSQTKRHLVMLSDSETSLLFA